jgi:cytochrome c-type biogenesis protein CcmH
VAIALGTASPYLTRVIFRAFLLVVALTVPALAVTPQERLDDPALEARARELSQELRCLVCQNQSIDDSNADLARDLRVIVRERLKAGDSDREVLDWIVARYGDFVLLRPPVKPVTWAMWFAPFVVLALGALAVALYFRRQRRAPAAPLPLTPEERRRLEGLLEDG